MSRKGFSLIEMMFVFVLAGVIMAIGFPRLRSSLEKQNIRSARALLGTLAATARGTAVARGCNATLNMTVDSVWVTACAMTPPFAASPTYVHIVGAHYRDSVVINQVGKVTRQ